MSVPPDRPPSQPPSKWRWVPWKMSLLLLGLGIVLHTWVLQTVVVQSGSMQPYLHGDPRNGDRVAVDKTAYYRGQIPRRFEAVVVKQQGAAEGQGAPYLVKRAVAFGGERVEIRDGELWIAGVGDEEPRLHCKGYADFSRLLVPVFRGALDAESGGFEWVEGPVHSEPGGLRFHGSEPWSEAVACRARDEIRDGYVDGEGLRVAGDTVVGDVLLRVWFTPEEAGAGFVAELFEGPEKFTFVLYPGAARGRVELYHHQGREQKWLAQHEGLPLGQEVVLELWNIDGRLGVAMDGVEVVSVAHRPVKGHMGATSVGPAFGGFGGQSRVSRVEIDRDLYYLAPPVGRESMLRIPEGHLFLLGDNSGHSRDSRHFGPVPQEDLVGRPFAVCWPLRRSRWLR